MNDKTIIDAYCPIKSMAKYEFDTAPKQHKINSFQSIGWPDPFPQPLEKEGTPHPQPTKDHLL